MIRTLEWQTPFAALWASCQRPMKADGNEPPAALRAAVPTGGRRSLTGGAIWHGGVPVRPALSTATSWKSVSPIRHAVRSVGIRASRVTVCLVNRLRFPGVRFGPCV